MRSPQNRIAAPNLSVSQWFNTDAELSLKELRGKVVVLGSFQMLCPGCVTHGLPQLQNISVLFPSEVVQVIGLHTVFEHHAAMTPVSLEAFIHEYRLTFPIGVDEQGEGATPKTMQAYAFRGTPSMAIIDKNGRLCESHFGQVSDLRVGATIASLLAETAQELELDSTAQTYEGGCDDGACVAPTKHMLDV